MKQIPNLFTLINLVFGCLALVCILQTGLTLTTDENGQGIVELPEKIYWAPFFIGCAAIIDFLDGFVARLMHAGSERGKQLDSLADVVSFGVAPAMIVYQFLRLSYAQQPDGLAASYWLLLPAFIIPCAGAYRLARFNTQVTSSSFFSGVPIPAAGLLIVSFPLIYWHTGQAWLISLMLQPWFWYGIILLISYLMVSLLPMLAPKFHKPVVSCLLPFIILFIWAAVCAFFFQWLAVPLTFVAYVILSLAFKQKKHDLQRTD